MTFFTALVAIFTGLLAWVAYLQWRTSRLLQRAYLSVEPLGIVTLPSGPDHRTLAHICIRNTGHLPARNVHRVAQIEAPHDGSRKEFKITGKRAGPYLVPSGATAKFGTVRTSESNIDARFADQCSFVWGEVTYDDGFNKMRHTKFCHRYPIRVRSHDGSIDMEYARYHDFGNDAD